MKNKRGQLTIFIIIAILIIAVVVLFFSFKGNLKIPEKPVSPETAEIQNFVQECLDGSLEEVIFRVGEGGGYYFPPKISTPVLEVPYYIKNNQDLMPSKEDIEKEISRGVSRELIFCLGDFASFSEYEITKSEITAETTIEPERVIVEINYPLTIIKDESRSKIKDFNSEVPVRFGIVYDAISEFVNKRLGVSGLCVDCLVFAFGEKNLKSTATPYGEDTYILIIEDPLSEINKKKFLYIFANEY